MRGGSSTLSEHLQKRWDRASRALVEAGAGDTLVLVGSGEPIPVPGGLDREHPFGAHPHYFWLCEQDCPGAVMAWDAVDGWRHFAPQLPPALKVWEGDVSWAGEPIAEFGAWLSARRCRAIAMLGVAVPGVANTAPDAEELDLALLHERRSKDEIEIERIRAAASMTAAGHARARELIESGEPITERRVAIEIEHAFRVAGADGVGYDTIVASGPHAAVFHAIPGERVVARGETVTVDAGAERDRYGADVTRVYHTGSPTALQGELVSLVTDIEQSAIAEARAGVEFLDLHRMASVRLARGLIGMGVLRGDAEELTERGAAGLFLPHGLGHLVGLGVRDATGRQPGREHRVGVGGVRVRLDARLEAGWVTTIEPGCYFVPGLLDNPDNRERFADCIDFGLAEKIGREIAGVRIEDDILITEGEAENLTAEIPHWGA